MLIQLEQVTKVYGVRNKINVLNGVNLNIASGDWISVVGPSGSGKTTLLNLIGCLLKPTSGRVKIEGIDTASLNDRELTRIRNQKIGFIFQGSYLMPTLTLQENVLAPVLFDHNLKRTAKHQKGQKATELLNRLGLGNRLDSLPHQLSLGQRRRVAIARALINEPIIILADEPTNDLDPERAQQVADDLKTLNEQGMTILMVTHHPDLAAMANRQFHLEQGNLVEIEGN